MHTTMQTQLFEKNDTEQLKGLSILLIVIHHIYQYLSAKYGLNPSTPVALVLQNLGWIGSSTFFLLSGYGMECSINKHIPLNVSYITNHLFRLIYPFLFIFLLDTIVYGFSFGCSIKNLLTLSTSYNQYWFLKEIVVLYLIILTSRYILKERKFIPVLIICGIPKLLLCCNLPKFWWNSVLCFPVGIIISEYKSKIQYAFSCHKWSIILSTFVLIVPLYALSMKYTHIEIINSIFVSTTDAINFV